MPSPSRDQQDEAVLAARYGDDDSLGDLQNFLREFGAAALAEASDEYGNTALHMAAANGHKAIVEFLVKELPVEALVKSNEAGNTALHWAALKSVLSETRFLD
jgi:ankyrin repeat protein